MGRVGRLAAVCRAAGLVVIPAGLVAGALLAGGGNSRVAAAAMRSAPADQIAVSLAVRTGGDGSGGMVLINPSGRRIATLSKRRAGREDSEPAWSPDGTRLAFTRTVDGRRSFQIYTMRADGKGVRRITHGRFDYSPSWSPDGRWIAYRSNGALKIVRPDGSGGRRVPTRSPTEITYPGWAPGGRIAYSYWSTIPQDWPAACHQPRSGCGHVVSSRLDGSQRRRIVRGRDAHWTRDGRAIVYTGPDGGVYIAPGSGGAGHHLGRGYRAEWSRDGNQIVYARMGNLPSQDSVWIMNRDGTSPHRISRGASSPAWRP
jgi:Tol biopolymer transport system component